MESLVHGALAVSMSSVEVGDNPSDLTGTRRVAKVAVESRVQNYGAKVHAEDKLSSVIGNDLRRPDDPGLSLG